VAVGARGALCLCSSRRSHRHFVASALCPRPCRRHASTRVETHARARRC
jgi:hypothetical protein